LRFPSWNEFTGKLSNFEKEVTEKVTKFKEEHSLLDRAIKESLEFLPPPFNAIAKNVYEIFDGTEEEKSQAVIEYLKNLEDKGRQYYEKTTIKLDNILIGIEDTKEIDKKQTEMFEEFLKSSEENQKKLLDEFKKVYDRFDNVDENLAKLTEINNNIFTVLRELNVPTIIDSNKKLQITKESEEKIKRLESEKMQLQKELEQAGKTLKIDVNLLLTESNFYFHKKDYNKVITFSDKVLSFDTKNIFALTNKGAAFAALGKFEEAIFWHNKALELNPIFATVLNNKGFALANLGKYEETLRLACQALEINPNHIEALINKGNALATLGDSKKGLSCFYEALKIDPDNSLVLSGIGNMFNSLELSEKALSWYEKSLNADPDDPLTLSNKGLALVKLGKFKDAIICYDKALKIDPMNTVTLQNKHIALKKLQEQD